MGKVKVRRTNREELPGIAVLRSAAASGLAGFAADHDVLDLDLEVNPDLRHLIGHDPDGFFTATDRDETLGFAAAHVRARQWILSELWVLPQHRGRGVGQVLLGRTLTYGERSGAQGYLAAVPTEGTVQALLLGNGFLPLAPVFVFRINRDQADEMASALTRLFSGMEVTGDLVKRRGQADLDRLDRLNRNITREVDHEFWLKDRRLRAAFVRQGSRNAAYGYGGANQVGPIAGSTQDAALSALGWALKLAVASGHSDPLEVRVPARFTSATDVLQDSGARLDATLVLYGKGVSLAFDRYLLGPVCLP